MDKLKLTDTLKSKSMTLTVGEIESIMDEELNKSPDEMDTELIELCADLLDKAYFKPETANLTDNTSLSDNKKSKNKKLKLGRFLLIAALITVCISVAVPVGAKCIYSNASNDIVEYDGEKYILSSEKRKTAAKHYSHNRQKHYFAERPTDVQFGIYARQTAHFKRNGYHRFRR